MLPEQGEQLAGHEGMKTDDAAILDQGPFTGRARQNKQAIIDPKGIERSKNLYLFAPQDIGHPVGMVAGQTGHNRERHLGIVGPDQAFTQLCETCRARHIGRFVPALPAAYHACSQRQTIWIVLHPCGYQPAEYPVKVTVGYRQNRSEEHTSELQSLMRISYAVFCLKKKTKSTINNNKKLNTTAT